NLDAGVAGVFLALADADVLDMVGAAAREDLVEDLGQEERIDDVAVDLDFLDEAGGRQGRRHDAVSGDRGPDAIVPKGRVAVYGRAVFDMPRIADKNRQAQPS